MCSQESRRPGRFFAIADLNGVRPAAKVCHHGSRGEQRGANWGDSMKAYAITTGIIFALLSIGHVAELAEQLRRSESDPWFVAGLLAIIAASGGLSLWAFTIAKRTRASAG
jgi:hypothetical protein